ncbi:hypothetical protein SAMN00017477_0921 [Peptoniphilus asaccharolyticus DSM 20463]|uniref:Uncharacterized protein n=1 Tax=Peptoniphilus asaccharolyticus DSM 20463 TaxID=573058 RepID=A0A1W1V0L5_PEPAS|nr:hypothetical protein [Peptoniphilus asaccharolyticus]MBL7575414.1 hypothetical protein [Peptoniphilus asaccharolyticus]SMB86601.1 hypothetical protein SAMN00017477_0921 [Peptoniphilus asaccharolyticus DSM 20463]
MYYIKGFIGDWKPVSKAEALEYGKNRLKALGLNPNNKHLEQEVTQVIKRHVQGIDIKEFEING